MKPPVLPPPQPAAVRLRLGLLLLSYAALLALGFVDTARPALFPDLLLDLHLSDSLGSQMFAVGSLGVAIGSALAGRLIVRVGSVAGLQLSLLTLSLGLAGLAFTTGPELLIAASLVYGLGGGGTSVCQNVMVEQSCPPDLRRRGFAGLHATYGVASLLSPLAVVGLLRLGAGWRGSLLAVALVPLAVLLPGFRVERPPRRPAASEAQAPRRRLDLLLIAFATGGCVVAEVGLSSRLPLLLRREGWEAELAGVWLSLFFLGMLAGRLTVTLLPLRRLDNRALLIGCTTAALAVFAVGLSLSPALLPLVGLCVAPYFPAAMDLLSEEFPHALEGAMGTVFAILSALLVAAHAGIGVLSDLVGVRHALWVGPGGLTLTLGLLLWSRQRAR